MFLTRDVWLVYHMSALFIIVNLFPYLIILRLLYTYSPDLEPRSELEGIEETSNLTLVSGILAIGHNREPQQMDVWNVIRGDLVIWPTAYSFISESPNQ